MSGSKYSIDLKLGSECGSYAAAGGGRLLIWKESIWWDGLPTSERMLPSAHVLFWAEKAISNPAPTSENNAIVGNQCLEFVVSARTAPLFRSSVIEMIGNNRKAIKHASETATTIRCALELKAGLP